MDPIKTMQEMQAAGQSPEILFWVGCAGSFDDRAQKVTRSFAEILQKAGISFAILGKEESCTGDPARRAGNEFLFQMMAQQNIATLNMYNVKKIVTTCPHCYNTLKNEYPDLGGNYDVLHHSQYLAELLQSGKIKPTPSSHELTITYHDSCYLGRANEVYEAPREVLDSLEAHIIEMEHNKSKGFCCGAGGAQMFKEEEIGKRRINSARAEEIVDTGAEIVVANCPFCITMLRDGIQEQNKSDKIMVYDLSELILNRL